MRSSFTLILSLCVSARVLGDESCQGESLLGGWKPYDEGKEMVDLQPVKASDKIDFRQCKDAFEVLEGGRVDIGQVVERFKGRMGKWKDEETHDEQEPEIFVALNGENDGILVKVKGQEARHGCFGTLANFASKALVQFPGSEMVEPKRLYSNTGTPIKSWLDIQKSDFMVYVLLEREAWVWSGVAVGFSWNIGPVKLTTVAMSPRVILAENVVSPEDTDAIIAVGTKTLFRSPEKHYSDDPKYQNYRTSETGNLRDSHPASSRLRRRCWQTLRLEDLEFVEPLQLLRYVAGKWYKQHHDVFHNVPALSTCEEQTKLMHLDESIVLWAEQQRQLLWKIAETSASSSSSLTPLKEKAANLFFSPSSELYPDLWDSGFRERIETSLGGRRIQNANPVDVHIAWLKLAFCADVEPERLDDCIIEAAEMLDSVEEDFGQRPRTRRLQRNRHVTMLPYLTDVEEGGETVFPLAFGESLFGSASKLNRPGMEECSKGIYVPPVKGGAAIFYHTTPDSTRVDQLSLHGGCPPVKGVKYAINVFCWNLNWSKGISFINGL